MKKQKQHFGSETKVTAFWGTGASGATAFALEQARQLALAGRKTLLIDHDLVDPSLMVYLAIDNYPSGLQAGLRLASQQRLTPANVNDLLVPSDDFSNLSFLAGLPTEGRFRSLELDSVEAFFEILRSWFDELVIDMGGLITESLNPHAFELQKQIISLSDYVYGVFRADPEGIAKLFWLPIQGELVANNYRPGSLGSGGKKGLKSVIADMTGSPLAGIAEDDDELVLAISKALAVGQVSKKSQISQLVASLVESRL